MSKDLSALAELELAYALAPLAGVRLATLRDLARRCIESSATFRNGSVVPPAGYDQLSDWVDARRSDLGHLFNDEPGPAEGSSLHHPKPSQEQLKAMSAEQRLEFINSQSASPAVAK